MDNAIGDNSPRVLLLPDSLPLLHSIYPSREEESNPEDLPSTVDIAALNELPLSGADSSFHMGNAWRGTAAPKPRGKPVETQKNDKPMCNGLKTPCHSEESQESDGSNSDSDSDGSGCKTCSSASGSSSNCSSSCSSGSSGSSESDSDEESNKSLSSASSKAASRSSSVRKVSSVPLVNGKDRAKVASKSYHHHRIKQAGYASSSDSRSSRERKTKQRNFSISESNYEPGSIKLRIAALKPSISRRNENYMSASSQSSPHRNSSPWLSEDSSGETKGSTEKKLNKQIKSSPVPDVSPKKSVVPNSVLEKKSAPSPPIAAHGKSGVKTSSWSRSEGTPERQKHSLSSPESDRPKKKSKLSCLMTSLSPKNRPKTTNGTLVNGNSDGRSEIKHSSPPSQQKYLPRVSHDSDKPFPINQTPRKNVSSPAKPPQSSSITGMPSNDTIQGNLNNSYSPSFNPGQITTPIKTKAAKKYIPEDHLVIPELKVPPPTLSSKKTNGQDDRKKRKKKIKKSSKDKKKKKKNRKKLPPEPEGLKEICSEIISLNMTYEIAKKSTSDLGQNGPFELKKYTNFDKELLALQIPAPPRNSFPRIPIASTSTGRKRKISIVNDRMKANSTESHSTQLQRLPLKKRHHHTNSTSSLDKGSDLSISFDSKQAFSKSPGFSRPSFDITIPTSSVFIVKKEWEFHCDFGDLLKPQPTTASSSHSTEKKKESTTKTGNASARKQKSPAKKQNLSVPKKKQALVSPDITEIVVSTRRSGRIRKPRKLDLESAESPSSRAPSPQKLVVAKPLKKDVIKTKSDSLAVDLVPEEGCTSGEAVPSLPVRAKPAAGLRKRAVTTPVEDEMPKKRFKPATDCDNSLTESEISTEVETDVDTLVQSPPSSTTTTPITSPPQQQAKKRRKVNKTGFPSIKKKKKSGVKVIGSTIEGVEGEGATEVQIKEEESEIHPEVVVNKDGNASLAVEAMTLKDEVVIPEPSRAAHAFSLTLSERVKMRKRSSLDSRTSFSDSNDADSVNIAGIIMDLVNIPDPPLVVPEKTNYLPCGLLSNYFKTDDPNERARSVAETTNKILPFAADPESGEFNTTTNRDFRLPYEIWCMGVLRARNLYDSYMKIKREEEEAAALAAAEEAATRKQEMKSDRRKSENPAVPGTSKAKKEKMPEDVPPSWNFKKIKTNTYYGLQKPPTTTADEQSCLCTEGTDKCLSDDCLNRVVYTECPSSCGDSCKNRRIQKHETASGIKRRLTPNKGYGVFTDNDIKKGDFIIEYVGEVVSEAVFKERMHTIYANDTHHYCLHLDGGLVIDGHRAGGEGRFVNHSCEPNCEMQKWQVNGLSRMALFASRDIIPGEELSYDYNFTLFNPSEGQTCYCGSVKCRGVIGIRTRNGKNGDTKGNGKSAKGLASATNNGNLNGIQDPNSIDKMKHLTKKDRNFVQSHNCFLIRNYEKIRKMKYEVEDKVNIGERLEKIMTAWTTRYKAGSSKNKPPQVPEDDPKLARLARISQIFYELFVKVTTAKDENGSVLCQPFMTLPTKRKCPQLYAAVEDPIDLTLISKKILRGEYRTLNSFELDFGLVLTSFETAYEVEKPGISEAVKKIKSWYKTHKVTAMDELEPFIVHKGNKGSTVSNELPKFRNISVNPEEDDVILCICERSSDEGMMVQCDKCCVWQHCDCMRVPYPKKGDQKNNRRRKQRRRNKFFTPAAAPSAPSDTARNFTTPLNCSTSPSTSSSICSPNSSRLLNSRPLTALNDDVEIADLVINVKDEIPMEIKEDSNHSVELLSDLSKVGVSEMDTQRIDVDGDIEVNRPPPHLLLESEKKQGNGDEQPYYCERCDPRPVDKEVPLIGDSDTPEKTHFTTLVREDGFLIRRNDTVYVLRDPPHPVGAVVIVRPTYLNAGPLISKDCDIFRIDSLWKDQDGKRFAYGHHYVRPSETYHEHNRRFYRNEICRSPVSEVISIDLIHGRCWVLDPATYCKGRPVGCKEEHVYICEFRVDKLNRSFSKVGKTTHAVCMKPFAFNHFETKIQITRNYHPHGPPSPDFKLKPIANVLPAATQEKGKSVKKVEEKIRTVKTQTQSTLERLKVSKRRGEQKERLKKILDVLQSKIPEFKCQRNDLTNLLGRKKQVKKYALPE
ncbi:unnamed protein product [Orchesella dallaii]|uniref:Histone-lysine N-methyltransferase ash1 n=1 Tax=Orchesella dallaii TaxID=48710 RepID=A0ABP1Q5A4_9HEXA